MQRGIFPLNLNSISYYIWVPYHKEINTVYYRIFLLPSLIAERFHVSVISYKDELQDININVYVYS